jgi:uncharacterized protein YkwD
MRGGGALCTQTKACQCADLAQVRVESGRTSLLWTKSSLVAVAVLVVGCGRIGYEMLDPLETLGPSGGFVGAGGPPSTGSGGGASGAGGTGGNAGSGGGLCLPPQTLCGLLCVRTDTNPSHCGRCDNPCPANAGCSAGQCTVVEANDLVTVINGFRVAQGCPALAPDPRLMAAAQFLSEDMAYRDFIDDAGIASDGSTITGRMVREGYNPSGWAELNAWTYPTANDVVSFWTSTANFRRQLARCDLQHIGVGHVYQPNDQPNVMHGGATQGPFFHYWTADLASPTP